MTYIKLSDDEMGEEKTYTQKWNIKDLKSERKHLADDVAELDNLISEAKKLGIE